MEEQGNSTQNEGHLWIENQNDEADIEQVGTGLLSNQFASDQKFGLGRQESSIDDETDIVLEEIPPSLAISYAASTCICLHCCLCAFIGFIAVGIILGIPEGPFVVVTLLLGCLVGTPVSCVCGVLSFIFTFALLKRFFESGKSEE